MAKKLPRTPLPCCDRAPEIGEYLVADARGRCCVGCYLSRDLALQGGEQLVIDALRSRPLVLAPKDVQAIRYVGLPLRHEKPHPDRDCRGCGTPLVREGKLVAHANQCPDCGEMICIPCFTGGKVKCATGKNARN